MATGIQLMSVESGRIRVESTFGANMITADGNLNSFSYIPWNEGSATATLTTAEIDPNTVVQSRTQAREKILGPSSATLKFTVDIAPTGTAAGSATAALQGALGLMLKVGMGGEHLGTGSTASSWSNGITGTVASAAGFAKGCLVGWRNANSVVEWRQVKNISTNTLTLSHGFSGTPQSADVIYACATYYMTEDPSQSVNILVQGQNEYDRWLLTGGQVVGGIDIAVDPSGKGCPTATFNWSFANYINVGPSPGTAQVTGDIADATYTNYSPIVGYAGDFRVSTVGTPTYATTEVVHVSACAIKPKVTAVQVTSPSGVNTVYRWRGSRANPPIEGSFTTWFDTQKWWTARSNKDDKHLQYVMGTAAGSAIALVAPLVQILNPQRGASDQEIEGQVISFAGRHNSDVAGSAPYTDLQVSPVLVGIC